MHKSMLLQSLAGKLPPLSEALFQRQQAARQVDVAQLLASSWLAPCLSIAE